MASPGWNEGTLRVARYSLVVLAVLIGWPVASAQAQAVQGCQPTDYLDRTAPGADRELTWDLNIENDPEKCLQVQVGQTVVWNGDLDNHPLGGKGGDSPDTITFHNNGSVTFTTAGTFGFECRSHQTLMKGAIRVVPAVAAVPALSPWMTAAVTALLLASGWALMRNHRRGRAAAGC